MSDYEIKCGRCEQALTHICKPEELPKAITALFKWRPEVGYPFDCEDKDVNAETVPFLSETYLYNLLGKEDARTLLALVNNVVRVTGLEPLTLQLRAHGELDAEKEERDTLAKRREERIAARKAEKAGKR